MSREDIGDRRLARLRINFQTSRPLCNGLEKSVGLTDVAPPESSTTAGFPAKAVLYDLPMKQEKAKVTLQLVVNTANIQIITVASLEDRILRTLVDLDVDVKNLYSPAIGHFRGQLTHCPNTNSQVPDSQEYNEPIATVADCTTKIAGEVST